MLVSLVIHIYMLHVSLPLVHIFFLAGGLGHRVLAPEVDPNGAGASAEGVVSGAVGYCSMNCCLLVFQGTPSPSPPKEQK